MNRNQFQKYLRDPLSIAARFAVMFPNWIHDDELYLKLYYRKSFHKKLNLDNPTTFSEKLQWLKLNNRCPKYTEMVDKFSAKQYVAKIIGEKYIVPTITIWNSVDEIDWDILPKQFVLKTTHDSGGIVICKDKDKLNKQKALEKLAWAFRHDNYSITREWPYKNVPRRIIAEHYLEDEYGELRDYKFLCFNGEPRLMFIATDRGNVKRGGTKFDFFDMDFKHMPIVQGHPNAKKEFEKPNVYNEMKIIAEKLSKGIPHVRVDLYNVNGKIYFGELTFFHFSGFCPFIPEKWDKEIGSWVELPK